ncbi:hypothetical protein [Thermotomaculum hydrothermale]|uniref:hypothetical protein n=1 Tax=Thermotomaculum hydrothermale TaxID=981385 RepID=UPI001915214C|nr:hypothetical protein [Thermotomaculum hydrothermale]
MPDTINLTLPKQVSGMEKSLTGSEKDKKDALFSTFWFFGSLGASKMVNNSSLPEEYKNLINAFVTDASNEGASSNQ